MNNNHFEDFDFKNTCICKTKIQKFERMRIATTTSKTVPKTAIHSSDLKAGRCFPPNLNSEWPFRCCNSGCDNNPFWTYAYSQRASQNTVRKTTTLRKCRNLFHRQTYDSQRASQNTERKTTTSQFLRATVVICVAHRKIR